MAIARVQAVRNARIRVDFQIVAEPDAVALGNLHVERRREREDIRRERARRSRELRSAGDEARIRVHFLAEEIVRVGGFEPETPRPLVAGNDPLQAECETGAKAVAVHVVRIQAGGAAFAETVDARVKIAQSDARREVKSLAAALILPNGIHGAERDERSREKRVRIAARRSRDGGAAGIERAHARLHAAVEIEAPEETSGKRGDAHVVHVDFSAAVNFRLPVGIAECEPERGLEIRFPVEAGNGAVKVVIENRRVLCVPVFRQIALREHEKFILARFPQGIRAVVATLVETLVNARDIGMERRRRHRQHRGKGVRRKPIYLIRERSRSQAVQREEKIFALSGDDAVRVQHALCRLSLIRGNRRKRGEEALGNSAGIIDVERREIRNDSPHADVPVRVREDHHFLPVSNAARANRIRDDFGNFVGRRSRRRVEHGRRSRARSRGGGRTRAVADFGRGDERQLLAERRSGIQPVEDDFRAAFNHGEIGDNAVAGSDIRLPRRTAFENESRFHAERGARVSRGFTDFFRERGSVHGNENGIRFAECAVRDFDFDRAVADGGGDGVHRYAEFFQGCRGINGRFLYLSGA